MYIDVRSVRHEIDDKSQVHFILIFNAHFATLFILCETCHDETDVFMGTKTSFVNISIPVSNCYIDLRLV